jgi:hypothetical protein
MLLILASHHGLNFFNSYILVASNGVGIQFSTSSINYATQILDPPQEPAVDQEVIPYCFLLPC